MKFRQISELRNCQIRQLTVKSDSKKLSHLTVFLVPNIIYNTQYNLPILYTENRVRFDFFSKSRT
jgi:hypothetical protein